MADASLAAHTSPRSNMSLVPYIKNDSQDIVLRHGSAVVLYDHRSRQISLRRDTSQTANHPLPRSSAIARGACPTCQRPYHDKYDDDPPPEEQQDASFTDPDYFRLLSRSLPPSRTTTQPPSPRQHSPRRRLPLAAAEDSGAGARAGARESERAATLGSPDGAEFVASAPAPSAAEAHGISTSAFAPNYFRNFFVVERELGRGGKGVVFLVKHILDDVHLGRFACKRVPVGDDHEWLKKVLVEVQLLTSLAHPNLVQYRHVWLENYQISSFGPSIPCAFILQQYCNAGDLHGYMLDSARVQITTQQLKERIRKRSKGQMDAPDGLTGPRRMNFKDIFSFFKDITAGLHHLHANGYIHRDLKPSNCLLHRSATGHLRVLVGDFGEVQVVSQTRRNTGSTGTISYCAPEVLRKDSSTGGFGNFSTKSDIFSLGMIVFFMCFGRLPYKSADQLEEENENVEQLREEIAAWAGFDDREKKRTDLPDRLYKFLKRLLSLDPNERPSTDDILQSIGAGSDFDDLGVPATHPHPKVFDDIKSRVSNLDTPSPTPQCVSSSSRTPALHNMDVRLNGHDEHAPNHGRHPTGPSRLRPTSPNREPAFEISPSNQSDSDPHNAYVEGEDSDSDSAVFNDAHVLLDNSVVLRPRKNDTNRERQLSAPPFLSRRLMLEPSPTYSSRISGILASPLMNGLIKVIFFIAKLVSLTQPCTPFAPRGLALYPLLALAVVDFITSSPHALEDGRGDRMRGLRLSVLLMTLHFAVLGLIKWKGGLCPLRVLHAGMDWT